MRKIEKELVREQNEVYKKSYVCLNAKILSKEEAHYIYLTKINGEQRQVLYTYKKG